MQGALWFFVGAVLAAVAIALGRWSRDGGTGFRCRHAWCRSARLARSLARAARKLTGGAPGTPLEVLPPQVPPEFVPQGGDSRAHGACCDQHWEFLERRLFLLGIQAKWELTKLG